MRFRPFILLSALMIAGCSPAGDSEPPPGAFADFVERSEQRAAREKAVAVRKADARAEERADRAVERIAKSERERRRPDSGVEPASSDEVQDR